MNCFFRVGFETKLVAPSQHNIKRILAVWSRKRRAASPEIVKVVLNGRRTLRRHEKLEPVDEFEKESGLTSKTKRKKSVKEITSNDGTINLHGQC